MLLIYLKIPTSLLEDYNIDFVKRTLNILKGKRNAYFEFLNAGFISKTSFLLILAIVTN